MKDSNNQVAEEANNLQILLQQEQDFADNIAEEYKMVASGLKKEKQRMDEITESSRQIEDSKKGHRSHKVNRKLENKAEIDCLKDQLQKYIKMDRDVQHQMMCSEL